MNEKKDYFGRSLWICFTILTVTRTITIPKIKNRKDKHNYHLIVIDLYKSSLC